MHKLKIFVADKFVKTYKMGKRDDPKTAPFPVNKYITHRMSMLKANIKSEHKSEQTFVIFPDCPDYPERIQRYLEYRAEDQRIRGH